MAEVIAVFDLEGTLCRGGSLMWRGIMKMRVKQGCSIGKVIVHVLSQMPMAFFYRLGLVDRCKARLILTKNIAALLKGAHEDEVNQLAQQISEKLAARLRPDMQTILQGHKQQGHKTVLTSGMFQPFLEATGQRLGVDLSIGTELKKRGNCYTGQLLGAMCFGEHKAHMLDEHIREVGFEVDLTQSYAYGDTIWDKPLLEMVGNAVAVYPDAELRAHAQKQGWRIIG